jgi:hypothetical protein
MTVVTIFFGAAIILTATGVIGLVSVFWIG